MSFELKNILRLRQRLADVEHEPIALVSDGTPEADILLNKQKTVILDS